MKISPVITVCLLAGSVYFLTGGDGIANAYEYLEVSNASIVLKEEVREKKDTLLSLTYDDETSSSIDKYVVEDLIKSSGSSIHGVKLLTMTEPTKVISTSSNVKDIPDGKYYEFEVVSPDIPLLLKKLDDAHVVCDVSVVNLSSKVFLRILTGGAFK